MVSLLHKLLVLCVLIGTNGYSMAPVTALRSSPSTFRKPGFAASLYVPCKQNFALYGKKGGGDKGNDEVSIQSIADEASTQMSKSVASVKTNLQSVRTGRASAAILDRVMVSYYDVLTPLSQVSTISVPSAQQLQVAPFDKSILAEIERGISEANIGLNPNNDGNVIRLNIPALTEDRRKELVKQVGKMGEDGKTGVRNIRRDSIAVVKKMEKDKSIGKDEAMDGTDLVETAMKKSIKDIDDLIKGKEVEVLKI